jgi:hypothetical protein
VGTEAEASISSRLSSIGIMAWLIYKSDREESKYVQATEEGREDPRHGLGVLTRIMTSYLPLKPIFLALNAYDMQSLE